MQTKMSLNEYKKKVEASLREMYPNITEKEIEESMMDSKNDWEWYMENFSPEMVPQAWAAGA